MKALDRLAQIRRVYKRNSKALSGLVGIHRYPGRQGNEQYERFYLDKPRFDKLIDKERRLQKEATQIMRKEGMLYG